MNKIYFTLLTLLGIAFAKAQTQKVWTLQECVEYALDNNISIKLAELQVENVAIDKKDAIGNFIPSLNGRATFASNTGANIDPVTNEFINTTFFSITPGISSNLRLFDGLANFKQLQRAKLSAVLSKYQLDQQENDILVLVANNYLQVLLAKENLQTLLNQHEITELSIQNTQQLVDAGSLPRGDLLEIKATYANEEQQIVGARNNINITLINLAQSLNISAYENFDIMVPELDNPDDGILMNSAANIAEKAVEDRPEIKIADQNIEIAEKDLELAKAARFPTIDGFFNYNTRYSDNDFFNRTLREQFYLNDGYSVGVQLSVPILNGFQVSNNIARNKINIENQRLQREQTLQNLEATIFQVHNDARAARARYEAALETVTARELAFQYAQDRYDVGLMNAFDYNQSQTQLLNARVNVNQAKYDFIFQLKILEIYFGVDPSELKL
ncbi:TolC family protein [Nonlabens xiamenensis]|uniref:TolC family protein n=1 Tax=Nonlabens xiamenensis TaxID=2341043 RepID=UPI000F612D8B|nr:TolC family protein [Nonlabens xiamenensis]